MQPNQDLSHTIQSTETKKFFDAFVVTCNMCTSIVSKRVCYFSVYKLFIVFYYQHLVNQRYIPTV